MARSAAEIHGIDLTGPIIDETLSTIRHTLADRGVVFFRDQWLTPEQHIAFARHFGNININPLRYADGYLETAWLRRNCSRPEEASASRRAL